MNCILCTLVRVHCKLPRYSTFFQGIILGWDPEKLTTKHHYIFCPYNISEKGQRGGYWYPDSCVKLDEQRQQFMICTSTSGSTMIVAVDDMSMPLDSCFAATSSSASSSSPSCSSHSSSASSPTVLKRKHAKVPVTETLPLKPLSPEDPLFKPRSFLQALKGPFADKWMQTALAEVNDLLKDGKIVYEYDMPEALGDQTPIQTKIVLDIQIKPGQEKYPEGKVLVFPEQWQPWTPFALYKGRLVPERGWGGYYSIEVASSMPAQNTEC